MIKNKSSIYCASIVKNRETHPTPQRTAEGIYTIRICHHFSSLVEGLRAVLQIFQYVIDWSQRFLCIPRCVICVKKCSTSVLAFVNYTLGGLRNIYPTPPAPSTLLSPVVRRYKVCSFNFHDNEIK